MLKNCDTNDFEIRITEGPIAYFNKITVGNDKTNDRVIYRELRTKPGEKYSKDELVRTVREIGQLGFLIQKRSIQRLRIDASGTVDIEYQLVEKDRVKLNFKEVMVVVVSWYAWTFVQQLFGYNITKMHIDLYRWEMVKSKLTFASKYLFQTYSVSFSEPWFGGKTSII
jgi:outer membrane protein insertion porin family